jgi:hypothetical protein
MRDQYSFSPGSKVLKIPYWRLCLACFLAGNMPTRAHGQAGLEYAARTAGAAMTNGSGELHVGNCSVNSSVIACMQHYYPTAFYVAVVGICVILGYALYPKRRA